MDKLLWQPSEKLKDNSLLNDFCRFINFKSSNDFKKIWRWSIDNPEEFWSKFWDYSKIIGNKVMVWSVNVTEPMSVRLGWKNYFEMNLFNKEGLPASSFRTKE